MGAHVHLLSNVCLETMTGDCAACGPGVTVVTRSGRPNTPMCKTSKSQSHRRTNLRLKYDLTPEDYSLLMSVQDGLCAICRTPTQPSVTMHVDHCHDSGKVRGLLCFPCNAGLGNFKDNIEAVKAAVRYLEMYADIGSLVGDAAEPL